MNWQDEMIQRSAALVEQKVAASAQLGQRAERLVQTVARFEIEALTLAFVGLAGRHRCQAEQA